MLANQTEIYTAEEYLLREAQAEYKSEYYEGQIVAMTGASLNHNRIVSNVHASLYNLLETKPCDVFASDLRLRIEEKAIYTYPDLMVIYGPPSFVANRTDTITNPEIIIEVLSESTAKYDRGDKFQAYWTLPSLKAYVLIDQYRLRVDYFQPMSDKDWLLRVLTTEDDVLMFASLEVEIPLSKIYRNIDWEE